MQSEFIFFPVWTCILFVAGLIWVFVMGKKEAKEALKEKLLKQKEDEAVRRLRAIEIREQKINQKISSIGLIEQASIAQKVIKEFPVNEYDQLKPMLTTESKKKDALNELNQKLVDEYEEALLVQFGKSEPFPSRQDYDHLLKDIMRLGYEAIIEQYGITKPSTEGGKPFQESSREISDSGTWQDIKRRA